MSDDRQPQPPPPDRIGMIGGIVKIIQSMTLTHVLIIALLVLIAAPSFVLWRFMNDSSLLNKWTSFYEELSSDKVSCTLRIASVRGADPVYSISTGFAFQGSDRWTVGVIMSHGPPDEGDLESYCATLNAIVDFMRRPTAPLPKYPNSDEPLIWQYPQGAQP